MTSSSSHRSLPDYAKSRRQLRRSRIQDALRLERGRIDVQLHRDRLLQILGELATRPDRDFGQLTEIQVETVVSVALTELAEPPEDRAYVLLECISILMQDGQFARVKLLGKRLASASHQLSPKRPRLRAVVNAIGSALSDRRPFAIDLLKRQLDPQGTTTYAEADYRQARIDLALTGCVEQFLTHSDASTAIRLSQIIDGVNDPLAHAALAAVVGWAQALAKASPLGLLQASDSTYDSSELVEYVETRGIDLLFPSQIGVVNDGLTSDRSLTVSLPTSSGKTLMAEFRIAAALQRHPGSKVIYVAPYRLLARQVARELKQGLSKLGHAVQDLGSGFDLEAPDEFGDVVVCTPERLDALLRRATKDQACGALFAECSVLVFDEMHLLGRSGRGPRFEMILARMRVKYPDMPLLLLSAASQGVDEIAQWLTDGRVSTGSRRPTGTIEVAWRPNGQFAQRVDRRQPSIVGELARTTKPLKDAAGLMGRLTSEYIPALAVCTQRAHSESLAQTIVETDPIGCRAWVENLSSAQRVALSEVVESVSQILGEKHPLVGCLQNGVAFHHAGVPAYLLSLIEDLSRQGVLKAVAATTTVAEGADLPFRTVVIPHLNFQGRTGKLERDLYLNIIGRAGRVNVSVEGLVVILDSSAQTLRTHISSTLWTLSASSRVRGQLPEISAFPRTPEELAWLGEFESQVIGWLGDGASYVENQPEVLASATFSGSLGNSSERRLVAGLTGEVLKSLERSGFALAASPYRLTESGERARVTGLSSGSVARLNRVVSAGDQPGGWIDGLRSAHALGEAERSSVAATVFESVEAFSSSLWLRRHFKQDGARTEYLMSFAAGDADDHLSDPLFWSEVSLVSGWVAGKPFADLHELLPVFGGNGLFGSAEPSSRVSDVAEYVAKIAYPGSWTWSAAVSLLNADRAAPRPWISSCIEFGVPSETGVELISSWGISRPGAIRLSELSSPAWPHAIPILMDLHVGKLGAELTPLDRSRFGQMVEQLERD